MAEEFNLKELSKQAGQGILLLIIIVSTWNYLIPYHTWYNFALLISIITAIQAVISHARTKPKHPERVSLTKPIVTSFVLAGLFYFIIGFGLTAGLIGLIGLVVLFSSYKIYKGWKEFKSASIHIGGLLGRKPK